MSAQVIIENPAQQPLQTPPRAYPYAQYSDDPNVGAFFTAYNQIALGYLQWFNQNCLGLYTNKTGPLLDWIGTKLYGLPRPIVGTLTKTQRGAINTMAANTLAVNADAVKQAGNNITLDDDYYRRYLTAWLYLGDGKQMSVDWVRRRVARFIYGENGSDINAEALRFVSITEPVTIPASGFGNSPYGLVAYGAVGTFEKQVGQYIQVTTQEGKASSLLALLYTNGKFPLPFQVQFNFTTNSPNSLLDANNNPFILNSSQLG